MTKLPLDVLLHVIELIDRPRDLLSLALTNRALYSIIVPRHIDYRRICCERSSKHLWKHLLGTPYDSCSRIRYLNISQPHYRTQIPRTCTTESECSFRSPPSRDCVTRDDCLDGTFETFIQALSKMVNMRALRLDILNENDKEFNLISEAIGKAGCDLEELGVFFKCSNRAIKEYFKNDKVSKDSKKFSLFCDYLPSLRKYSSRTRYDTRPVLQMILNAPNLTHITVVLSHSHAFISGYWPNLQQLSFHCPPPNLPKNEEYIPRLQKFLHRHSKLIVLSTSNILHTGWAVESDDFLPNLTSYSTRGNSCSPIITANIAARLVHLTMNHRLYSYLSERRLILSNLKSCVFWDVRPEESTHHLVDIIPNIQNLFITFERVQVKEHFIAKGVRSRMTLDAVMRHVAFYANFKNLRVLIGPFRNTLMDKHLLSKALYEFPRLLYTELRLRNGTLKFCHLKRDDIAKVMIYEYETTGILEECNVSSWNSLYDL